ncbi:DUF4249 domain-containing protein [Flavobacterium aquidurense]|uniref:DUF4249 domain-containing protein n=1 Tax=Flavobacterium aquidurense TaxID=362413 RepID=UPI00285CECF5|nr:DUF4249 domain-containing protein [Flavobacterium aquidurense]MDR7369419.1 hypothetical protein [Flavobacterium aquidurense]
MKNLKLINIVLFAVLAIVCNSCTEAYPLLTNTYEEALVVEATITNELKIQEIKLTKTAKFEDESYLPESGAEVSVTDDAGNHYNFRDDGDRYVSEIEFQAVPQKKYQLHIKTKDGRSFESSQETLPAINPMQDVKAAVETKDGKTGVSIRVNSYDPNKQSNYYRFEYEETYKIVTPRWVPTKAVVEKNGSVSFVPNSPETKVCYGYKKSTDLLLESTNKLSEDRLDYLIRFISDQNYIITTRYSILVKQYVESLNAYTYYSTLKQISGSGTALSPTQPGILLGNIRSVNNSNSKIVGYFDVTSVSTERIYFNYSDLFPGAPPPPYYTECTEFCYAGYPFNPVPCTHEGSYADGILSNSINYLLHGEQFIFWVNAPCGDCTTFASNLKPPFWID